MGKKIIITAIGIFTLLSLIIFVNSTPNDSNNFIGESGISWDFDNQEDTKQEVSVEIFEFNESVLELKIDNHPNSSTKNNYKWDMALCNSTGTGLKYMNEDAQGGFEHGSWLDVNYGKLTDYGLNETWCGGENNYGYILFSSGSKNQFPKTFRFEMGNISNYTLFSGTGSAILVATGAGAALRGTAENICRDSNGLLHIAYEGSNDDLWYANSSDDGDTWTTKNIFNGTILESLITCGVNNLTVVFVEGFNVSFIQSTSDGASWGDRGVVFNEQDASLNFNRPSCVVDSNDVVHCVARRQLNIGTAFYINSSRWDRNTRQEQELGQQDAIFNDTNHADIEVDIDNNVYIIGTGILDDDVDIWSSKDNWATRNPIDHNLGTVNGGIQGQFGMDISINGSIYYAGPHTEDLQFCSGSIGNWNGGSASWSCQELSPLESRVTDITGTLVGDIYILHQSDNLVATSNILKTNSSDGGTTFPDSRNITDPAPAIQPSIASSLFPITNRLNNTLRYVFSNATGVFYATLGVAPPRSCFYLGYGDWKIVLEDNCIIGRLENLTDNAVDIVGSAGNLTINASGHLVSRNVSFLPSGPGDSFFIVQPGGNLSIGR